MNQAISPTPVLRPAGLSDVEKAVDLVMESANQRAKLSLFMPSSRESIQRELEQASTAGSLFVADAGDKFVGCLSAFLDTNRANADCSLVLITDPGFDVNAGQGLLELFTRAYPAYSATFFIPAENTHVSSLVGKNELVTTHRELLMSINRQKCQFSRLNMLDPVPKSLLDGVAELHDRIFPNEYISGEDIKRNPMGDRTIFSITDEDTAIAYGVLRDKSDMRRTAEVVAVDQDYRGKGYGRTILESMLAYGFRDPDISTIDLIVEEDNVVAVSLYTSVGFNIESENISYVLPPRMNTVLPVNDEEGN